jgi:hypothetical protein
MCSSKKPYTLPTNNAVQLRHALVHISKLHIKTTPDTRETDRKSEIFVRILILLDYVVQCARHNQPPYINDVVRSAASSPGLIIVSVHELRKLTLSLIIISDEIFMTTTITCMNHMCIYTTCFVFKLIFQFQMILIDKNLLSIQVNDRIW